MIRILAAAILPTLLLACDRPQPPPQPPPEPVTVSLRITNMHCRGCAMAITEALEKIDGVEKCSVRFESRTADLVLDPMRVTTRRVATAIEELGYGVAMPKEADPQLEPAPAPEEEEEDESPDEPATESAP